MSESPWIAFYPSDWLAGTRGLSAAETGIYITLVASMYERGEPIPEDHARLARLCGSTASAFKRCLDELVSAGKIVRRDAALWNDRVGVELDFRSEKREQAKAAANRRWEKDKQNQGQEDADAMREQSERICKTTTTTTTTDSSSLRSDETRAREGEPELPGFPDRPKPPSEPSPEDEFFETFWPKWPHKVGKPDARRAWLKARKGASLDEIMTGVRAYIDTKPPERPWLNPSTFLNQERWTDAPAAVAPRPNGHAPPAHDAPIVAEVGHSRDYIAKYLAEKAEKERGGAV